MGRIAFVNLFFTEHLYAQRITADDLGLDSDSGGGEIFFGALFIVSSFHTFAFDNLENVSASYIYVSLFFLLFGMFCVGIRTPGFGIPFFVIFFILAALVRFLKNNKK